MRIEFRRDPDAEEPLVLIIARERSPEVEALLRRISAPRAISAWDERGETLLSPDEIIRVYTERRRVLVDSERGTFGLRARLYELEARLGPDFLRISNSELVRRDRILRLDFGIAGTIRLSLRGGGETYVSRRYVSRIRKTFE